MPQLDPSPWFFILSVSWLVLLTLAPTKLSKFHHLNDPTNKVLKGQNKPWFWSWP